MLRPLDPGVRRDDGAGRFPPQAEKGGYGAAQQPRGLRFLHETATILRL
jgi:hypothetical protein